MIHGSHETPVDAAVEGTLVISDDGAHWAAITGESATRALWITIDGSHIRRLVASEVFGDETSRFGPWLERELHDALVARGGAR